MRSPRRPAPLELMVGSIAVAASALYLASDVIELAQGGFSTFQLWLTYVGEVTIPFFAIGLYAVQRPRIGRLGLIGAVAYAYAFVFFTSTIVYALVRNTPNWDALTKQMGTWIIIHGVVMVLGGLAFGLAVVRSGVLPRWTGIALMVGVVLVAAASNLPDAAQTGAAAVRDLALAGMGASLLRMSVPEHRRRPPPLEATPRESAFGTAPSSGAGRRRGRKRAVTPHAPNKPFA